METKTDEQNITRAQSLEGLRRDLKAAIGEDAAHNARVAKHLGELLERAFDRIEKIEASHYETNRQLIGVRERVKELREFQADATGELNQRKLEAEALERKFRSLDDGVLRLLEVKGRAELPPNARPPLSPHLETNLEDALRLLEHEPPYVDQARAEVEAALRRLRGEIG